MENKFYTGYKDRKGKKIFVGDIIVCLNSGREYKAIYDDIGDKYCLSFPSEKVILSFDCFKQDWLEKKEQNNGNKGTEDKKVESKDKKRKVVV